MFLCSFIRDYTEQISRAIEFFRRAQETPSGFSSSLFPKFSRLFLILRGLSYRLEIVSELVNFSCLIAEFMKRFFIGGNFIATKTTGFVFFKLQRRARVIFYTEMSRGGEFKRTRIQSSGFERNVFSREDLRKS